MDTTPQAAAEPTVIAYQAPAIEGCEDILGLLLKDPSSAP